VSPPLSGEDPTRRPLVGNFSYLPLVQDGSRLQLDRSPAPTKLTKFKRVICLLSNMIYNTTVQVYCTRIRESSNVGFICSTALHYRIEIAMMAIK
jgi:hypothetical protein